MKAVVTHKNATVGGKRMDVGAIVDLEPYGDKVPAFLVNKVRLVEEEPVAETKTKEPAKK